MWPKAYKDYKTDEPLIKNKVESSRGIIGYEGHEINGWGNFLHIPEKETRPYRHFAWGFVSQIFKP